MIKIKTESICGEGYEDKYKINSTIAKFQNKEESDIRIFFKVDSWRFLLILFIILDRVSCSPICSQASSVPKAGFELVVFHLPSSGARGLCHHACFCRSFFNN